MPDQPAKQQRFEVGMRVRVAAGNHRRGVSGLFGEVVRLLPASTSMIGEFAEQFYVKLDTEKDLWIFSADELEPAPAAKGEDSCTE